MDFEAQPCNKCQCPIVWDQAIPTPKETKRFVNGKKNGWWREDASKEAHTPGRCLTMVESKEFGATKPLVLPGVQMKWNKDAPDIKIAAQTDVDKALLEKMEQDAYHQTHLILAEYKGCVKACIECGLKEVQGIGLIFKVLKRVD